MEFSVHTRIVKNKRAVDSVFALSVLVFFIIECSVLIISVIYYKGMLEKV